ncbi:MAG: hypothetical protein MUO72_05660 [Bacteroidales bacterium]|nr:hypothetical protein [Bacteroidales bacterium]
MDDPSRDSYDYVCYTCRDSIVIAVSGSALASSYFEKLNDSPNARNELQADIRQYSGKYYPLYEDTLAYFLQIIQDLNHRSYSYRDWEAGYLGANLSLYTNISKEDKELILSKQKEIFTNSVDLKLEGLIVDLKGRSDKSINVNLLHSSEIKTVRHLLFGNFQKQDGIIKLGNWELYHDEILSIQKYYRDAINGVLDLSSIVNPNQKVKIGTINSINQAKIKALAYHKYLNHLESISEPIKHSSISSKSEDPLDLLQLLYKESNGHSSKGFNLFELGKILGLDRKKSGDLALSLKKSGFIEMLNLDGEIELTPLGILKIENDVFNFSTNQEDKFSKEELRIINSKIDSILEAIEKLDVGHEVIFEEIESLRVDAQKFSKKDFKSMALGKLFSLGIDGLLDKNDISSFLHNLLGNDFNKYLKWYNP